MRWDNSKGVKSSRPCSTLETTSCVNRNPLIRPLYYFCFFSRQRGDWALSLPLGKRKREKERVLPPLKIELVVSLVSHVQEKRKLPKWILSGLSFPPPLWQSHFSPSFLDTKAQLIRPSLSLFSPSTYNEGTLSLFIPLPSCVCHVGGSALVGVTSAQISTLLQLQQRSKEKKVAEILTFASSPLLTSCALICPGDNWVDYFLSFQGANHFGFAQKNLGYLYCRKIRHGANVYTDWKKLNQQGHR